jgi:hypothetical protein
MPPLEKKSEAVSGHPYGAVRESHLKRTFKRIAVLLMMCVRREVATASRMKLIMGLSALCASASRLIQEVIRAGELTRARQAHSQLVSILPETTIAKGWFIHLSCDFSIFYLCNLNDMVRVTSVDRSILFDRNGTANLLTWPRNWHPWLHISRLGSSGDPF